MEYITFSEIVFSVQTAICLTYRQSSAKEFASPVSTQKKKNCINVLGFIDVCVYVDKHFPLSIVDITSLCKEWVCFVFQSSSSLKIRYESWLSSSGVSLSPFHVRWNTSLFNWLFARCARLNPHFLYIWYDLNPNLLAAGIKEQIVHFRALCCL